MEEQEQRTYYAGPVFDSKAVNDQTRTITGWASTLDPDRGNDIVLPEAFAEALAKNPAPPLLYNHRMDEPIGRITDYRIDPKKGLWIEAVISKTVDKVWTMVKEKILSRFSFGYRPLKHYFDAAGRRVIQSLELFEVSIVAVPMQDQAAIETVVGKAWAAHGLSPETARLLYDQVLELSLQLKGEREMSLLNDITVGIAEMSQEILAERGLTQKLLRLAEAFIPKGGDA